MKSHNNYNEIEITENRRTKQPSSMHGCVCLICREYRDEITNNHASTHGFKNKDEMILNGKVQFLNPQKERSMEDMRQRYMNGEKEFKKREKGVLTNNTSMLIYEIIKKNQPIDLHSILDKAKSHIPDINLTILRNYLYSSHYSLRSKLDLVDHLFSIKKSAVESYLDIKANAIMYSVDHKNGEYTKMGRVEVIGIKISKR